MSGTRAFLWLLGGFYTLAGVVTVRATLRDAWFNAALDALGGAPPARAAVERTWWLLCGGLVVGGGGLLLLASSAWAVVPFVLSSVAQATYLLVLAPRRFDVVEAPTPEGRRQTTNAFWVYVAMTVVVAWAAWIGALRPLRVTSAPAFAGAMLLWMLGALYAIGQLRRMARLATESPDTGEAGALPSELPEPAQLDDE